MQRGSIREYVMLRQASGFFFFNAFFSVIDFAKATFFFKDLLFFQFSSILILSPSF